MHFRDTQNENSQIKKTEPGEVYFSTLNTLRKSLVPCLKFELLKFSATPFFRQFELLTLGFVALSVDIVKVDLLLVQKISKRHFLTLFYMGFWRYVNTWGGVKSTPLIKS